MLLDHLLSRVGRRLCQVAGPGQASCPSAGRRPWGRTGGQGRPVAGEVPACPNLGAMTQQAWDKELRARGYRVTPQRQLVLEAVTKLEHASPEEIWPARAADGQRGEHLDHLPCAGAAGTARPGHPHPSGPRCPPLPPGGGGGSRAPGLLQLRPDHPGAPGHGRGAGLRPEREQWVPNGCGSSHRFSGAAPPARAGDPGAGPGDAAPAGAAPARAKHSAARHRGVKHRGAGPGGSGRPGAGVAAPPEPAARAEPAEPTA